MTAPIGRPWLAEILVDGESRESAWFAHQSDAWDWVRNKIRHWPKRTGKVTRAIADEQESMFVHDHGREELNEALARVDENAHAEWKEMADAAYREAARRYATFTNDAVWEILAEWDVPPPHEARALGARARKAITDGWVEQTGQYVPSKRANIHRHPIAVYRSLVYHQEVSHG